MIRLFLLLLSVVFLCAQVQADGISLSQSIDQSDIPFEGEAHFEIVITWNGSQAAYLFDKPLAPQFDRLKVQRYASSVGSVGTGADEVTTKTYSYTLQPTSSGAGHIEPVTISYLTWPDSIPGQLMTEPMMVMIAAPIPVEEEETPLWVILLTVGFLCGMAIGVFVWWLNARSKKRQAQAPVESPAERFLKSLAALRLETGNDLKKFQTGLYKILVTFLVEQYGLAGDTGSADAVLARLAEAGVPEIHHERISGWLVRAEKAKFSPLDAAPGETIRMEAEIREFFEKNMMQNR